jgi:hypothetical protein
MTVPKIEATAKMISRAMVSRSDERDSQREEKNPFSSLFANPHLRKKLALSFYSTPVADSWTFSKKLLLVAFAAISLVRGAESFFSVMANTAIFTLGEGSLGYFVCALFHLKNLGMAVRTFGLLLGDVGLMAKVNRAQVASLGFKLDIAPAHFLLLRIGRAHCPKA